MNLPIALFLVTMTFDAGVGAAGRRPNILLIMTDDQGFGDVQSHGNPHLQTPTHDLLASRGARFERFFVSPVCAPTRASLLTGRWHLRTGVHGVTRGWETMRASEITLAEMLRDHGYATGIFGKWHNGAHYPQHPNGQGFDEFVGFCAGHWNNYFDSMLERNGQPCKFDGFVIDWLTDRAIEFIDRNRDSSWFCYVPFNTPHSPWQVPDANWEKFRGVVLPDDKARCAYAMVENIDANLRRLLDALDDRGLAGDTIVLFLTDNGANSDRYNAGMKGRKGSLDEGGTRVPLFIRWPGRIAARTITNIAAHVDIVPTLLELAGIAPPDVMFDGISLVPLLMGIEGNWPERTLFTHWGDDPHTGLPRSDRGAVRTQRWRAVLSNQHWALYDMRSDPGQRHDVAALHPMLTTELASQFENWFRGVTSNGFQAIPTEIGHPTWTHVVLPGHEAVLHTDAGVGISYQGRAGWANDWITNWTDSRAYPAWDVDVIRPGTYVFGMSYAAPSEAVGTRLRLEIGDQTLNSPLRAANAASPIASPDRVPRSEVLQRNWGYQELGVMTVPAGRQQLVLRIADRAGARGIEVKAIDVRPVAR